MNAFDVTELSSKEHYLIYLPERFQEMNHASKYKHIKLKNYENVSQIQMC